MKYKKVKLSRRKIIAGIIVFLMIGLYTFNRTASHWVYSSGYQLLSEYLSDHYGIAIHSEEKELIWTVSSPGILLEKSEIKMPNFDVPESTIDSILIFPDMTKMLTTLSLGLGKIQIEGLKTKIFLSEKLSEDPSDVNNFLKKSMLFSTICLQCSEGIRFQLLKLEIA